MARETLTCEIGPHAWSRETKRGRKPRRCPEHEAAVLSITEEDVEIIGYVDVPAEPVTLRSTKTSKKAPQSPQEPRRGVLATGSSTRSGSASSGRPGGRKGQKKPTPSPGFAAEPEIKITPADVVAIHSNRAKDRAAAKIKTDAEAARTEAEQIATGEIKLQDLYCENGDHDWSRPAGSRGRKPANCPHHPNPVNRDAEAAERRRKAEKRVDDLEFNLRINGTHISQHQDKAAA